MGAVAVSQRSADALVENGTETADRIHVVYPPYERPAVLPSSTKSSIDIPEGSDVLLFVGRITEAKGAGLLPALLARLPTDCVCVVVGDGPFRQPLIDDAEALGVASRFHLVGDVVDVRPFYAAADVYVAPTWREGLVGYATLDAAQRRYASGGV